MIFRGAYIDNGAKIIGVQKEEDSLLNWCLRKNITDISLYGAATLVGNSIGCEALNSFIDRAHSILLNVSLIASTSDIANNEYTFYKKYPNKFDGITTEYEFWNSGQSYTAFKDQLKNLQVIHDSSAGNIKRNIYLSRLSDAEKIVTDASTIAQRMIASSDRIFLVNYSPNAYNMSGTAFDKIKQLAKASAALNKTIEIVILFNLKDNSNDPNIYQYFFQHRFDDAFNSFKNDFDNVSFSNKNFINLIGYQLFNYSFAKDAKP